MTYIISSSSDPRSSKNNNMSHCRYLDSVHSGRKDTQKLQLIIDEIKKLPKIMLIELKQKVAVFFTDHFKGILQKH